jgi:hypothetical protein
MVTRRRPALAFARGLGHKAGMVERGRSVQQRLREFQRHLRKMVPMVEELLQTDEVLELEAASRTFRKDAARPADSEFRIERYGRTRFWALYEGETLLAVTVYRRGAEKVRERLQTQEVRIAELTQALREAGLETNGPSVRSGAVERLQAERKPDGLHQGPSA